MADHPNAVIINDEGLTYRGRKRSDDGVLIAFLSRWWALATPHRPIGRRLVIQPGFDAPGEGGGKGGDTSLTIDGKAWLRVTSDGAFVGYPWNEERPTSEPQEIYEAIRAWARTCIQRLYMDGEPLTISGDDVFGTVPGAKKES
jgi:hypothetical protein